MPIRFYCPLGHRLQVPSARAGKKGRCPICQQKVIVPVPDPQPSGRPKGGVDQEIVLDQILAEELGIDVEPPPVHKSPATGSVRKPPKPSSGDSKSRSMRHSKPNRANRAKPDGSSSSIPPLPPSV